MKNERQLSNCCFKNVIPETDICSKCKEHCEVIEGLRLQIIELTGEDPIDIFGEDWELHAEDYIEEYYETEFADKFGKA